MDVMLVVVLVVVLDNQKVVRTVALLVVDMIDRRVKVRKKGEYEKLAGS